MSAPNPIAEALRDVLVSPNVSDSNFEAANVVDALDQIARALWCGLRTKDPDSHSERNSLSDEIKSASERIATALTEIAISLRVQR